MYVRYEGELTDLGYAGSEDLEIKKIGAGSTS